MKTRYYRDINSLAQWLNQSNEPIALVLDPNRDDAKLKQYDRACRMVDGDYILSFVKGVCCWTGVSVVETNKAKGHERPLNALNSDDLWDQHFGYALDVRTDFQLTTPEQCFFTSNSLLGLKYQGRGIYMEMHRRGDCERIVEAIKTADRPAETIMKEMDSPSMKRKLDAFIREWDETIKRDHYPTEIAIKNSGSKCDKCGTTAAEWVERMQRARQDNGYRDVFSNSQYGYTFFDVHHKVPVAKGGGAVLKNLRALCPNCHRVISRNYDAQQKDLKQHGLVQKRQETDR
jgi:5-methylcytosine-specific restriction endonuclease McrA